VSQTAARRTVTEVQYNFDSFAGTSNGWISAQGTIEARFSNQFITPEFRLRKAVYEGDTLISEDFSKSGNNKITVVPTNTSYYDVTILSEYGERVQFMKKSGAPGNFNALSSQGLNIDPVEWTGSLQVNDAARPGSFVNIYPGDKFYVRTQVSSGWTMSGVYTFTLQNSDQVCHLGGIM
jgi:hypothetical protein